MKYRPEIDGLRAVAVLIVLIFHIDKDLLPGGFIGVDVFFVISGFLITSIIQKSLESQAFTYRSFYLKRIKRLIPLFFAVVIFSLIVGYFILLPYDYQVFGGDIVAANIFLANIKSALSFNYFSSDQLLLHFWSLAVEEQFYFLMPTLLLVIHKYFKRYLIPILLLFFIGSIALAQYMSSIPEYAQLSYFLLPTRAWELLAGCLLAIIKINISGIKASMISLLGIGLLILSVFIIDETSVFPGLITLLPVTGTILIILGGENGFGQVLKTKPMIFIGLMSYSIYMWHWPIIIIIKSIFKIDEFSIIQMIGLSTFIIGVSYLSRKYIEDFFRYVQHLNFRKALVYYYIIPFLITTAFSFYVYKNSGLPERYGVDTVYTKTSTTKCPHYALGCFITQTKDEMNNVLMVGDSHAEHFSNLFTKWFDDEKISLRLFASGGCNFYSESFINSSCEVVKAKLKENMEHANTAIIAKRFDQFFKDEQFLKEFKNYITQLTESGKTVILLKQVPKFKDSDFLDEWMFSKRYGTYFDYENNTLDSAFSKANETIVNLFAENSNVHILDLNNELKVGDSYKKFDQRQMPLYYNANHLTAYASDWIYERIKGKDDFNWVVDLIENKSRKNVIVSKIN